MTTSRPMRGMAVLATGALLWGLSAGPAAADSIRDSQWPLQRYAATTDVWPVSQGEGVTVGVIDSGVIADHQDLAGSILPGADLTGDGGDGHKDLDGHGTSMAALIAGHGHGSGGQDGISGLAPKAKILPVRIDGSHGAKIGSGGSEGELTKAIRYAADHGAKVINMSFAGGEEAGERDAVNYALGKDIVLVAGTGNDGSNGTPVEYPAAFPGVVAVSAVDKQGMVWANSDRGPEVTLAAPGVEIATIKIGNGAAYQTTNGTSDATAYVSAIAALIRSKYPNLSAGQVINRMIKSAVAPPDKSAVPNEKYGYGIASPREALKPNPAVDNGPKENPLLGRTESRADDGAKPSAPSSAKPGSGDAANGGNLASTGKSDGGIPVYVFVIAGVLALVVIVGVIVLVRRSRGNGDGGPGGYGGGGGGSGFVPPGPPPYGPGAQQFPPQQPPYAGQVPQPQGSGYGGQSYPQPPAGASGGNPYR